MLYKERKQDSRVDYYTMICAVVPYLHNIIDN